MPDLDRASSVNTEFPDPSPDGFPAKHSTKHNRMDSANDRRNTLPNETMVPFNPSGYVMMALRNARFPTRHNPCQLSRSIRRFNRGLLGSIFEVPVLGQLKDHGFEEDINLPSPHDNSNSEERDRFRGWPGRTLMCRW